jgi:hypothetical protein
MTNPLDGEIAYVGTRGPRLGVFVVDVAGAPRVVVGPTARAYEHVAPLGARLTDRASRKLPESALSEPWARSYTVAAEPAPPLVIGPASLCRSTNDTSQSDAPAGTLEVRSNKDLGAVTIELLDHHQRPVASVTKKVGKATTTFQFAGRSQWVRAGTWAVEGVHIKVGASHTYVDTQSGRLPGIALGGMRSE